MPRLTVSGCAAAIGVLALVGCASSGPSKAEVEAALAPDCVHVIEARRLMIAEIGKAPSPAYVRAVAIVRAAAARSDRARLARLGTEPSTSDMTLLDEFALACEAAGIETGMFRGGGVPEDPTDVPIPKAEAEPADRNDAP